MTDRLIAVDLSSFQASLGVADYKYLDPDFAIIKTTENTNYVNPYARGIVDKVAAAPKMKGFAFYHFGRFYNDYAAVAEADYFVKNTKAMFNIKAGTLLYLDAEIAGMPTSSVLCFIKRVQSYGYKCGFYSYKYLLSQFNMDSILNQADTFWIAAYPHGENAVSQPDFNYFPSYKNIDLWQFTSKYKGYNVDASVTLTDKMIKLFNPAESIKIPAKNNSQPKPAVNNNNKQKYDSYVDNLGVRWYKEKGKFKITVPEGIVLRWGATTSSSKIAVLPKDSVVEYDQFAHAGGYIWIRQPRSNGYGFLPTGQDKNGTRLNYWGSFS